MLENRLCNQFKYKHECYIDFFRGIFFCTLSKVRESSDFLRCRGFHLKFSKKKKIKDVQQSCIKTVQQPQYLSLEVRVKERERERATLVINLSSSSSYGPHVY